MTYTIGEFAKKLCISIHAIRYYEKQGLLPEIKRNEAGNRVFQKRIFSGHTLFAGLDK